MSEKCDGCGTELIDNCMVCGAPVCCPRCCEVDHQQKRIAELEATIKESKHRIKNGLTWLDGYGDDFEMAKDDMRAGYEILKGGADE